MTNKKLMIIVTPEMELLLNRVKKEIFYNSSQSDMTVSYTHLTLPTTSRV